ISEERFWRPCGSGLALIAQVKHIRREENHGPEETDAESSGRGLEEMVVKEEVARPILRANDADDHPRRNEEQDEERPVVAEAAQEAGAVPGPKTVGEQGASQAAREARQERGY